ncbi:replication protein A 70 kDa DNA-binding subunit B [Tanacetum coccineum]
MGYQKTPGAGTSGGGSKGYRKGGGYGGYGSSKGFCGSGSSGGANSLSLPNSLALKAVILLGITKLRDSLIVVEIIPVDHVYCIWMMKNHGDPKSYTKLFRNSGEAIVKIRNDDNDALYIDTTKMMAALLNVELRIFWRDFQARLNRSMILIAGSGPLQDAQNNRSSIAEMVEGFPVVTESQDNWATMWDEYAMNREALGHVVFILQFGKVKYWDGTPAIHNAMFGSKIFINYDLPEIAAFRTRVQDREGYDANQLMIQHVAPEVKVVTVAEFFHRSVKKMVGGIRECDPDSHCIVYATIHRIHKEHGWAYTACKSCNKRVDIITHVNRKPTFVCDDHGNTQAAARFKCRLLAHKEKSLDQLHFVFFNTKLLQAVLEHTVLGGVRGVGGGGGGGWELMEKYGMDTDDYFPEDLDEIVGKKYLFKVYFSEYNYGSGSGESSGVKKRRVFIDLDELDTESEDDEGNSNAEDFVKVKVEPEE